MSQRNPQNARYSDGGKKGVSKKSAGSVKPKSTAGSSVYVSSGKTKAKGAPAKQTNSKEQRRKDEETIRKGVEAAPEYKYFRRCWLILIIVAIVGVVASFAAPRVMVEGAPLAALAPYSSTVQIVGLALGYAGLIAAFVVDFKKIRPIRKAQEVVARKESKKERAHREAAEAEATKKKKPLFGRKKD